MSDVINSIFGRPKNDTPTYGGYDAPADAVESDTADVAGSPETVDTESIEAEVATESGAEEPAESGEAVTDEDAAEVVAEDDGIAEEAESVAAESEDAPAAVAAGTDAEEIDQAEEPVTAGARPAAGTRGTTTVDDGVVSKIVNMVARKAEGVHTVGDDDVSVEVDGDIATIKIALVVEFGHVIKALAEQIRIDVIGAVEQFLGLDVASVDVRVRDIHLPDAD